MDQSIRYIGNNIENLKKEIITYQSYKFDTDKSITDLEKIVSDRTLSDYDELFREINRTIYSQPITDLNQFITLYQIVLQLGKQFIELDQSDSFYKLKEIKSDLGIKYVSFLFSIIISFNTQIKLLNEYLKIYEKYQSITSAVTSFLTSYNKTDEELNREFFSKIFPNQSMFNLEIYIDPYGTLILPTTRFESYCMIKLNQNHSMFFVINTKSDGKEAIIYNDCDTGIYNFTKTKYNFYEISLNFSIVKTSDDIRRLRLRTNQDVLELLRISEQNVLRFRSDKLISLRINYYGCKEPTTGYKTFTRRQFVFKRKDLNFIIQMNDPNIESIKTLIPFVV